MMASFTSEERAFKVDINITKLDDSSPVFYKIDGERFKETHTLKLQIETTYRVSLEFRPPVEVSEISIGEGNLEYKLKRSDDKSSCYECSWSTNGISESKNKDRLHLVIFVKFADNKQLNAKVQCKMYSLKDKNHITWGTCLKNLQLDCKIKDGQTYVDVQQVLFK
ncbi:PREDICTED: CB1 cannabinoid receptor-interacting protein 1-like [Acropora digitifera]|uniref:CB1 cannabinoid receptor-interacting protein 1-like n=1 Tax=Acropora digitifera TaxID=70779 RepID=UPI00077ACA62|nr:PREDICTED: CB1 cannabinoid receptor-interacting protein 1-like [Acropora digitifera]